MISCFALSDGKERIIQKGYPRNDALFGFSEEKALEIRRKLNIPDDKRVILYCPTFRDNGHDSSGYTLQGVFDTKSFMEKYSKFAVLLIRTHYFIENGIDIGVLGEGVTDVSGYDDILQTVKRILSEPAYKDSACKVSESFRACGGAVEARTFLEELVMDAPH